MQSFLESVADKIFVMEKQDLKNTVVIFPSRRALVFFKKSLSKRVVKNGWAPQMFSMEDFFTQHSSLIQLDQIDLLLHLYEIHKIIEQSNYQDFDTFIGWATILLQDFNELDRHLIDAEELYAFLNEAKAIERWELDNEAFTEVQDNYLKFWSKLKDYYTLFCAHLSHQNCAYQGQIFRTVAENKAHLPFKKSNLYFVGFNAFTKAEQLLIDHYVSHNSTKLIFDSDDFYLKQAYQEAGIFLRQQLNNENAIFIHSNGFSLPKDIKVYGVSGNIGQAKLCGNLIEQNKGGDIAVIMADEQLLMPLLDAIPQNIDAINVTMGYPIAMAVSYRFADALIQMYHEAFEEKQQFSFIKTKVIQLLNHPFWVGFNADVQKTIKDTLIEIEASVFPQVKTEQLKKVNEILGYPLFSKQKAHELIDSITFLFEDKRDGYESSNEYELTELHEIIAGIRRLNQRIKSNELHLSWKSLSFMFRHVFSKITISFVGEAISGLQIMGILESRTLDFDSLIITSVNEKILPSGKSQNSFIPYDIKRKFGLPSYREKDAIYAYHFYRLLSRAKDVKIIYNTKNDGLKGGEKSRFVYQLSEELKSYCPESKFTEELINQRPPRIKVISTEVIKNDTILSKSAAFLKSGWSASSLNNYMNCPLNFYYEKILGIKPSDKTDKAIELNIFGEIIHKSLEALYKPYLHKALNEGHIKNMFKEVDLCVRTYFTQMYSTEFKTGVKNLAYEVAKKYIQRVLQYDQFLIKENELIIEELETTRIKSLAVEGLGFPVRIIGNIDRVDRLNGVKRIIDYKTGTIDSRNLKVKDYESLLNGGKKEFVQLITYQYLMENDIEQIGLLPLKNKKLEFLIAKSEDQSFQSNQEIIEKLVSDMSLDLLNKAVTFRHSEASNYCKMCL